MVDFGPATGEQLAVAAALLRRGELVGMPTETVYGLASHALKASAVARIFEVKGRPRFDPLIVHIAELAELPRLAASVPEAAMRLANELWPGPVTLVLPKTELVPDLVTAGLGTVAIRMPRHPVALALIRGAGVPVAAPSANRFGAVSPTTAAHVREAFSEEEVPIVLEGGACEAGVESTVISFASDRPTILRPGATTREQIEGLIGAVDVVQRDVDGQAQASPGMNTRHYAPGTPMTLVDAEHDLHAYGRSDKRVGLLTVGPVEATDGFAMVEVLSLTGDLAEAAAGLFAAMRRLDAAGLDRIVAMRGPGEGLGAAINDRLRRAGMR